MVFTDNYTSKQHFWPPTSCRLLYSVVQTLQLHSEGMWLTQWVSLGGSQRSLDDLSGCPIVYEEFTIPQQCQFFSCVIINCYFKPLPLPLFQIPTSPPPLHLPFPLSLPLLIFLSNSHPPPLLSLSQELMAKSFIRNPGQSNLVRVGVGREGIFKLDSKMDKVGGACCHW